MKQTSAARGVFATFMSAQARETVSQGVRLFAWPFIVRGMGAELYGAYILTGQIAQFVGTGDFRLNGVLGLFLARSQKSTDFAAKRRMIGAHFRLCWWLILIFGSIGAALMPFSDTWFHVPEAHAQAFRISVLLMVLLVGMRPMFTAPLAGLQAHNMGYRGSLAMVLSDVSVPLLSIAVVYWGGGLVGLSLLQWVGLAIVAVPLARIVRKALPWWGVDKPTREDVRTTLSTGMQIQVDALAGIFTTSSPAILLGLFSGLEAVSAFAIAVPTAPMRDVR